MLDSDTLSPPAATEEARSPLREGGAPFSGRTAVARGRVRVDEEAFARIREGALGKGDVLTVAAVAGRLGAKAAAGLIPNAYPVPLEGIDLDLVLDEDTRAVEIRAYVKAAGQTGVEIEALTAVSVAALTVYDMCKSVSREITLTDIQLVAKTGGQSGDYRRQD
jgi:cyclic pyranopterin monophosphate synthase